ncbi:PspA/IM30 family protein [Brevibacillus humidisoli]|uniref:PspA/IM30 family protein n=1 Tax=Brevibacillus humidisoli TaxID=2895522 RepID=UPI001E406630|nr:PspA/IM30 family protein [Brevibacillus humidisoli]UFJ41256.1 PspA/IM30 family protein [Brevibacillus humidisoli]
MGIFKRLRDVTVASVNDVIDSMEDPVTMLNQYMRDMEAEIGRVEVAVARQVAVEKKFRQQYKEALAMAEKRDRQATLAISEGEDDLARRALLEKKQYSARADEYQKLYETASTAAQQMREKLAELKDEFYKMRAKKYELTSRAQVARTQKQLNQVITGLGNESASRGFSRMEEKVLRMEAEAEMSGERLKTSYGLDRAFEPLIDDEIEAELKERKEKLNGKAAESEQQA